MEKFARIFKKQRKYLEELLQYGRERM